MGDPQLLGRILAFWSQASADFLFIKASRNSTTFKLLSESGAYSFSNPWLVNLSVRQFSPTVRTVPSGTPEGTLA